MRTALIAILAGACLAAPQAAAARAPASPLVTPGPGQAMAVRLLEALDLARAGEFQAAYDLVEKQEERPDFAALTADQQHVARLLLASIAEELGKHDVALAALQRATAWPRADANDWLERLRAGHRIEDTADEVLTATRIARAFPDTLRTLTDRYLTGLVWRAEDLDADGARQLELLQAMFDQGWTPDDPLNDPSEVWVTLAERLIARGDLPGARKAAAKVAYPYTLVRMRADLRFDPVFEDRPDVGAAAERYAAEARKGADAAPKRLKARNFLLKALLDANRPQEALEAADAALALAAPADGAKAAVDDPGEVIWTLDSRARALAALGRWDEAVESFRRAARRPEHGSLNVSQAINLGQFLVWLGRPQEGLEAVSDLARRDVSAYGWLSAQLVRLCANVQLGKPEAAAGIMAAMKAGAEDGPIVVQHAMLCAGDLDGAAAMFIARLESPDDRGAALVELQDYTGPANRAPFALELDARRKAVRARPDVQAALAKVGRVEAYPVTPPAY